MVQALAAPGGSLGYVRCFQQVVLSIHDVIHERGNALEQITHQIRYAASEAEVQWGNREQLMGANLHVSAIQQMAVQNSLVLQ